jgi:ABC-type transport system involved in multi-copper enzyme maturation permease subunit
VPWSYVGVTTLYATAYIALLLLAAVVVFSKRDFK